MILYQNGREAAFNLFHNRHSSKIYGFLIKKLNDKEFANEVFQMTFLNMHKGRYLFKSNLPFLPWLYAICKNVLKEVSLSLNISTADCKTLEFSSLPKSQQMALELRYLEGFSFYEISKKLNTTPENVRQLISRATKKLKSIFLKEELDERGIRPISIHQSNFPTQGNIKWDS